MRKASPDDSLIDEFVIFERPLSEEDLTQFFPIEFEDIDVLAAPEPSMGAMIRLESGHHLVIIYGKITHSLAVLKPPNENTGEVLQALFNEVPQLNRP